MPRKWDVKSVGNGIQKYVDIIVQIIIGKNNAELVYLRHPF